MAAGKSTVAQLLAEQCARSAHIRGDAFRRMIVSGRAEMRPDQAAESLAQFRLRYRLGAMVADGYASAGFTAVVQDVILGPELAGFVDCIRTRPRYVVVLIAQASVLAERDRRRSKTGYGEWAATELDTSLRNDTLRLGLWLDNSELTPAQTVAAILDRLPEAAVA
jgi:cytidylate kinase